MITAFYAVSNSAAYAQTTAPMLTYVMKVDETTAATQSSATSYLQVSATGDPPTARVVTPGKAAQNIALGATPAGQTAEGAPIQCYRLVSQLLPDARELSPGMDVRGGTLSVRAGTAEVANVTVNFAARALAPELERVYVYTDPTSAARFSGSFDFVRGVLTDATLGVATAGGEPAFQARECRMTLLVPNSDAPATANI
jgi:hypothetical protein